MELEERRQKAVEEERQRLLLQQKKQEEEEAGRWQREEEERIAAEVLYYQMKKYIFFARMSCVQVAFSALTLSLVLPCWIRRPADNGRAREAAKTGSHGALEPILFIPQIVFTQHIIITEADGLGGNFGEELCSESSIVSITSEWIQRTSGNRSKQLVCMSLELYVLIDLLFNHIRFTRNIGSLFHSINLLLGLLPRDRPQEQPPTWIVFSVEFVQVLHRLLHNNLLAVSVVLEVAHFGSICIQVDLVETRIRSAFLHDIISTAEFIVVLVAQSTDIFRLVVTFPQSDLLIPKILTISGILMTSTYNDVHLQLDIDLWNQLDIDPVVSFQSEPLLELAWFLQYRRQLIESLNQTHPQTVVMFTIFASTRLTISWCSEYG